MLIILPEFTIKLEDFTAFKVVKMVWGWTIQGFTFGEWRELYSACCEEDAREKKELLDEAIMISQGSCCPECGETDMKSIRLVDCCEECCADEEKLSDFFNSFPDCCGEVRIEKPCCEEGDCCTQ